MENAKLKITGGNIESFEEVVLEESFVEESKTSYLKPLCNNNVIIVKIWYQNTKSSKIGSKTKKVWKTLEISRKISKKIMFIDTF